jgi:hypothetical protein
MKNKTKNGTFVTALNSNRKIVKRGKNYSPNTNTWQDTFFPHSWLVTGFATGVTGRVPLGTEFTPGF